MDIDEPYNTLGGLGESQIVVDRSRFLGQALPVESLDEALRHVEALRSEHHDARHVCFGLRVGRGAQGIDRSNDDGEPSRTGGFPLWQLLDGDDITDALIAVVRYYGGVKLGTGGLARAYREAGREALREAGIVVRYPETELDVTVPYDTVGKVEHLLGQLDGARVEETDYAADVTFRLAVRCIDYDDICQRLGALLNQDPESFGR